MSNRLYRLFAGVSAAAALAVTPFAFSADKSASTPANFYEVNTPVVNYLLCRLRDRDTDIVDFQLFSNRLLRVLVEETLAKEPMVVSTRISGT
jgi:hypothetical protein